MPGPGGADLQDGRRSVLAGCLHDIVEGQRAGRAVNLQTLGIRELPDQKCYGRQLALALSAPHVHDVVPNYRRYLDDLHLPG